MAENLTSHKWQYRYCSSGVNAAGEPTDILHDFYLPALTRITQYDRVAGYFRSSSLAAASQGYTAFLKHEGQMRLIVGADLQLQDVAAILAGNRQRLSDRLMDELKEPESWPEEVQNGVSLLSQMVASGQLEVRVAFRVDSRTGEPISVDSVEDGYVHEKWFIMRDDDGHRLYGSGSLNESKTALMKNAENIDVHCDWAGGSDRARVEDAQQSFLDLWENRNPHMKVMPIPEAVKARLIRLKDLRGRPTEIDGTVLTVSIEPSLEEVLQFAVLRDAPKMPGGIYLGMYTAPVSPWPHQEIVSRRLVESWPYSYMMCDEVGLGKTIEAALAIRSLVLSGRTERVLIVAPASLTEQWHRELAQKAMLPFELSKVKPGGSSRIQHKAIYPQEQERVDSDLYSPALNIVSSGLVSRKERSEQLKAADPCDIILVDEAHYARRQNPRENSIGNPKYGNLYRAIQGGLRPKTQSLWMATATPMQIDAIEVFDLFKLTNRCGEYQADPELSMEYFHLLGEIVNGRQLTDQQWSLLGQSFAQIEALDPYLWKRLQLTTVTSKNRRVLADLPIQPPKRADIKHLVQPMFSASPLSRVMMRHTRALLEIYRQNGELTSNLATRHVRPVCAIQFTPAEQKFYAMLDDYCAELSRQIRKYNPQTRQVMVFLLNFLQLRFASSLYAIKMTLSRRLQRVENTLRVGARAFETQEELEEALEALYETDDSYNEGDLDDITLDALLKDRSKEDLEWEQKELSKMLEELGKITETPSKIQTLLIELERRRKRSGRLRQTVLFTRFYDSLHSIREYLRVRDGSMRVGIYAGGRAVWYNPALGRDENVTHEEIKRLFLAGEIDLLLCTDAAAEGLNLQTADLLINFDLGWNPMKIEQRIGRIDRIGQKYNDIEVLNMCYLGSTEEIVYGRLLERLQQADLIVGAQQISMLPVEPKEFRDLQKGTLTLEELTKESIKRLKKQKEATASMEMSAEDMYQMYNRMSSEMRSQHFPASLDDLWTALTSSPYLQNKGAVVDNDGIWHLPENGNQSEIVGTIDRNAISEKTEFLTWGSATLEQLFEEIIGDRISKTRCIRKISVSEEHAELVGYAVASVNGPVFITSYDQLNGVRIDTNAEIDVGFLEQCALTLQTALHAETSQMRLAKRAEEKNKEIAELHEKLLSAVTVSILKQKENEGSARFSDAIKALENNLKEMYYVDLPIPVFSGKATQLLFPIAENSGRISIVVRGVLLECAISLAKRTAASLKGKPSEKLTSDVIRRLDREGNIVRNR